MAVAALPVPVIFGALEASTLTLAGAPLRTGVSLLIVPAPTLLDHSRADAGQRPPAARSVAAVAAIPPDVTAPAPAAPDNTPGSSASDRVEPQAQAASAQPAALLPSTTFARAVLPHRPEPIGGVGAAPGHGIGASASRSGVALGDAATRAGTGLGRFFRDGGLAIASRF
jgi:hypothetical protein